MQRRRNLNKSLEKMLTRYISLLNDSFFEIAQLQGIAMDVEPLQFKTFHKDQHEMLVSFVIITFLNL